VRLHLDTLKLSLAFDEIPNRQGRLVVVGVTMTDLANLELIFIEADLLRYRLFDLFRIHISDISTAHAEIIHLVTG